MTTAIEDNELNAELQELYLVNKQWLSDLEFLDTELEFLTKLAANNAIAIVRTEELNSLQDIGNTYVVLKRDILNYLHQLEPLIVAKTKDLDITLIENYTQLKNRLSDIFEICRATRKEVFSQNELPEGHSGTCLVS